MPNFVEVLSGYLKRVLLDFAEVSTNVWTRAFAVGAPTLWNMLPSSVKSVVNIANTAVI